MAPHISDIREQFPLKRDETQEIAKTNGLRHPSIRGVDQVMSSDFLVDSTANSRWQFVVQVKSSESLNDAKIIEKLEIERRY